MAGLAALALLAAPVPAVASEGLSRAWTRCMTPVDPPARVAAACARVLHRRRLSRFHRVLLLLAEGDALAAGGRNAAAVARYDAALALRPHDEDLLAARAGAERALGQLADAERDLSASIAAHRRDPANLTNGSGDILAGLLARRGQVRLARHRAGALADFDAAMAADPGGVTPMLRALRARAAAAERS